MIPEILTQIRARLGGYKAGRNSRIDKAARISPGTVMGELCEIHPYVILERKGGKIEIGNNVSINPACIIYGHGGIKIGNDVRIAAQVVCVPANHNYDRRDELIRKQGQTYKGIVIEDDVWIGTGAKILDGVTIAKGCVIAAGAVVSKSTEPYGVYAGVPARKIKERGDQESYSQMRSGNAALGQTAFGSGQEHEAKRI